MSQNIVIVLLLSLLLATVRCQTLMDIIQTESDLGEFREYAQKFLAAQLSEPSYTYTVFAPTDDAFRKVSGNLLRSILADRDALRVVVQSHVVDNFICGAAIVRRLQLLSRSGRYVNLSCSAGSRISVGRGHVVEADILADDAVIHAVDRVILPDSAKSLVENLEAYGLTYFRRYLRPAGLLGSLGQSSRRPYTLFVPSDRAFIELGTQRLEQISRNRVQLRRLLLYHMGGGKLSTHTFIDDQNVPTLAGAHNLRVQVYRKGSAGDMGYAVENANIQQADIMSRNGAVHIIDKVLSPVKRSIMHLLQAHQFSEFRNLLINATSGGDDSLRRLLIEPNMLTAFIPTNKAFQMLSKSPHWHLISEASTASEVIKYHLLGNMMLHSCFVSTRRYRVATLQGGELLISHTDGAVYVNGAVVDEVHTDRMASNGVVHVINEVLIPFV